MGAGSTRRSPGLGDAASAAAAIALVAACLRVGAPQGDFANYTTAAALWLEGADLARLYDYRWFTDQAARVGLGDRLVGFPVLTPPSVLLAVPLVPLGLARAGQAWLVLQALLAVLVGLAAARAARLPAWVGLMSWIPLWPALRAHLEQGQAHLLAVAAVALGLWAWSRARDGAAGAAPGLAAGAAPGLAAGAAPGLAAGAAIGLAVGLKVFAWPLVGLALLARRPRVVVGAALVLLAGAAGSLLLLGADLHASWLREIAPATAGGFFVDPWHPGHQSLAALGKRLWLPHPALGDPTAAPHPRLALGLPAALALLLPLLAVAGGAAWDRLDPGARSRLLAAATLAALATAPNVARYSLVLLLPPLLLAVADTWRQGRRPLALALVAAAAAPAWAAVPAAWPPFAPAGVPRALCLLLLWSLLLPWRPWPPARLAASLLALLCALAAGLGAAPPPDPQGDGARPLDHPDMPLVAADLLLGPDGRLYFTGLSADRGGLPGRGWIGFALDPDEGIPRRVEGDPGAHVFSPRFTDEGLAWAHGPTGAALPAPVPCGGGLLVEVARDGQQDIAWQGPDGALHPLSSHPAHDAAPACDLARCRAWFLSDRGVGVRALRLWWSPLPSAACR